ncbi:hypothetical protein PJ151_005096 [Klebsiella pneumoniae]|nr:hypothetical protein [Klebsiella pneumoniae]
MDNKKHQYFKLLALILMGIGLFIIGYLIYSKEKTGTSISIYFLLAPPIIISIGLSVFYKRIKRYAELLYAIAAAASALTLCLDALPNSTNNLFPYFFQSILGYLILVWIAALSLANILYTFIPKIIVYFINLVQNNSSQ